MNVSRGLVAAWVFAAQVAWAAPAKRVTPHTDTLPTPPASMQVFARIVPEQTPLMGPGRARVDNLHWGWSVYPDLDERGRWKRPLARAQSMSAQQASWLLQGTWRFERPITIAYPLTGSLVLSRLDLSLVVSCEPSRSDVAQCTFEQASVQAAAGDGRSAREIDAWAATWEDALVQSEWRVRVDAFGSLRTLTLVEPGPLWVQRVARPMSSPDGLALQSFVRKAFEPAALDRPKAHVLRPMAWTGYVSSAVDTWVESSDTAYLDPSGARLGLVGDAISVLGTGEAYVACASFDDLCHIVDAKLQTFDLDGRFREGRASGLTQWVRSPQDQPRIATHQVHLTRIEGEIAPLAPSGLVSDDGKPVPREGEKP